MDKRPTVHDGSEVSDGSSSESANLVFVATMADTTWRMFVPTVGMTLLGVWVDAWLHTKPWMMFLGIVLGIAAAMVLVARQIKQLKEVRR